MILTNINSLTHPAHILRFMDSADSMTYSKMIVVSELEEGRVLFLSGWIGKPLAKSEWIEAGKLFPKAEVVRFDRWNAATKTMRAVEIRIPRP